MPHNLSANAKTDIAVYIDRNLLATRTRRLSLFQHPFIGNARTSNKYILPAMVLGLAFCFFFSYVPFFQTAFLTRGVAVEHIFIPFTVSRACQSVLLVDRSLISVSTCISLRSTLSCSTRAESTWSANTRKASLPRSLGDRQLVTLSGQV